MNWKRMYVLLVCSLLLFGLQAGVGIATSDDASSITHIFKNTHATNTYSDLHIEYTKNVIAPASNPIITGAGGATVTAWARASKKIDIDGSFPPGSSVNVEASSTVAGLKVAKYWWTVGGDRISPIIPVYYVSVIAGKEGNFKKQMIVKKPKDTVKVTITGAINIAGGTGGISVQTKELSPTQTEVTFEGNLINSKKKGIVSATIDPPEEIFDLVINA